MARLELHGATTAHHKLQAQSAHWTQEFRSLATNLGGEGIWLEKVLCKTKEQMDLESLIQSDEALGGLVKSLLNLDISGGRDILGQKGDVGQALFSAGAGLSSLHGIIEALEKEYGDLFKSGGSRPELNQAIRSYQDLKKEIRALSLSSSAWKEQKETCESAGGALEEVEQKYCSVRSEVERLRRLQRAMPHLAKRVTLLERLGALGDLGHLPPDFSSRVQDPFHHQKQASKQLQDARSRQTHLDERESGCSVRQDILDQSETIDAFTRAWASKGRPRRIVPAFMPNSSGARPRQKPC